MTFFFPFFLDAGSFPPLVSKFLFKEDLRGDITTSFDLVDRGSSLISILDEGEELDSSTI